MDKEARKVIIEVYDAQDSEISVNTGTENDDLSNTAKSDFDDDDKIFFTKIGRTEITVDKILTMLLINEVPISILLPSS